MMHFTLDKYSEMPRDKLYAISVNVKNFPIIMPKYFESINITESAENNIIAEEKIFFLGNSLSIKTRHMIIPPNTHEVHIVSGIFTDSSFIEKYDDVSNGTNVTVDVSIQFNGISKIFLPLGFLIKRKMSSVLDEFLESASTFDSDYDNAKN